MQKTQVTVSQKNRGNQMIDRKTRASLIQHFRQLGIDPKVKARSAAPATTAPAAAAAAEPAAAAATAAAAAARPRPHRGLALKKSRCAPLT